MTTAAVARLDARISASHCASAWTRRAAWSGFGEALRGQGVEIDEIDIFGQACGLPLPSRSLLPTFGDDLAALAAWHESLARRGARHWREALPFSFDPPADWGQRPLLLRALELTARHARADRTSAPWLALPALLHDLGITYRPLPSLAWADKALRLQPDLGAAILKGQVKGRVVVDVNG